jgi:hypothetical protein
MFTLIRPCKHIKSKVTVRLAPCTAEVAYSRVRPKCPCDCEISGSHGGEYEYVFWDVAPCSLVEIDRRFRGITG